MRNIRLVLAYDGTDFHGWQVQPDVPTIQGCVGDAIARIVGEKVKLWASGRTDAGVHALSQVANFKTASPIPGESLVRALNNLLPPTIRVKHAEEVGDDFHARYDVCSKFYRYRIHLAPICPPFLWRYVWHYPYPLERELMSAAACLIEGEHDFTSFAAAIAAEGGTVTAEVEGSPKVATSRYALAARGEMVRRVISSRFFFRERTSILVYDIRGDGFLHHMVRNIVGTLVEVGKGRLAPQDLVRILQARDRTLAGPTAPARGLCLMEVEY